MADGDSFTLVTAEKQYMKIRLPEIDAPEAGQPFGNRSKQNSSEIAFGKDVWIIVQTKDRYGRTIGRLYATPGRV